MHSFRFHDLGQYSVPSRRPPVLLDLDGYVIGSAVGALGGRQSHSHHKTLPA